MATLTDTSIHFDLLLFAGAWSAPAFCFVPTIFLTKQCCCVRKIFGNWKQNFCYRKGSHVVQ